MSVSAPRLDKDDEDGDDNHERAEVDVRAWREEHLCGEHDLHRQFLFCFRNAEDDEHDSSDDAADASEVALAALLLEAADCNNLIDDDPNGADRRHNSRGRQPVGQHVADLPQSVERDTHPPERQTNERFRWPPGLAVRVSIVRDLLRVERDCDDDISDDGEYHAGPEGVWQRVVRARDGVELARRRLVVKQACKLQTVDSKLSHLVASIDVSRWISLVPLSREATALRQSLRCGRQGTWPEGLF